MSAFQLFKGSEPCPICESKDGRCKRKDELILCMGLTDAVSVAGYRYTGQSKCRTWGLWAPGKNDWNEQQRQQWQDELAARRRAKAEKERRRRAKSMPAAERDRHYRAILQQLTLHPTDRADLKRRGLSDEQIAAAGFKSVERRQRLERKVHRQLPGIQRDGTSLYTQAGYLCPIRNADGLIVAAQVRLRDASSGGKYRWLSSATQKQPNGASPHLQNGELPLSVYRPESPSQKAIALVEGVGAKPFITAERLNLVTIGAAGGQFASSPQTLKASLDTLSAELGTQRIEFYPDAGMLDDKHKTVRQQYQATWQLLTEWGYELAIAWWGQAQKADGDIDEINDLTTITFITPNDFERLVWLEQCQSAAKAAWRRTKTFTPDREANQRYVSLDPGELSYDIHALRSTMGTGKTAEVARILNSIDAGAIAIGSRNSLLLQSCERWGGFYHLHHDSAFGLTRDPHSRIACCIDSLTHFDDHHFDGKILILDEVVSVVKHALLSSTLKDKRLQCLAKLEQAIQRASVVLAWDGNCADIVINYLAALRGPDCRVLKKLNQYRADALNVEIVQGGHLRDYSPVVKKLNESLAMLKRIGGGAIAVISDSQRQCEALDDSLSAQGHSVLRIDSKTITEEWAKQFLKAPDRYIEQEQPDALILSPTAESGIDISIQGYFKKGFAFFFGVIDTDTQLQFVRRVRDLRDWCMWVQEYTTLNDWEGTRSPFARTLQKNLLDAMQMDAIAALDGETEPTHLNALLSNLKQQATDPHTQTALQLIAARNYERSHMRECLQEMLEQQGHQVRLIQADADPECAEAIQQAKEHIQIAHSHSVFNAEDISASEAFRIKSSFGASLEQRYAAEKALLKVKLPGIEFTQAWSPDLIRKVLFEDRTLLSRLERFWMLKHLDVAQARQAERWQSVIEHGSFFTDIRADFVALKAMNEIGLLALVDGRTYSADSPEIQAIYRRCKRSKRLQTALGRSPGKLSPMDFVGRLMRMIGVRRQATTSPRDERGDRTRLYTYLPPETDSEAKTILDCLQRRYEKYLNSESDTCADNADVAVDHLALELNTNNGQGDPNQQPVAPEIEGDRQSNLIQVGSRVRFGTSLSDWEVLSIEGHTAKLRIIDGGGYHTIAHQTLSTLNAVFPNESHTVASSSKYG